MHNNPATTTLEAPAVSRRTFCLEEANRALVYVSRVTSDIVDLHDEVVLIRRTMERVELGLHGADPAVLERDYRKAMDRLRDLVRELDTVGVDLQDFERGVVTFPTLHNGCEASLSWQLGETEIGYWHHIDAGVDAREAITSLRM